MPFVAKQRAEGWLSFSFFLFFFYSRLECLETNKNFGGNRGSGSAISGGNLGFTIGHVGKPRLLRFVAGVTGWKNRLAARSFAWPRSFPRTRLTGGGGRGKKLIRWVAEIGENKIFSRFLSLPSNHSKKKATSNRFRNPEYLFYISSLFPPSLFFYPPPKKKKAAETSLKMLVGDYSIEIARHWPRLWIL